MRPSRRSCPRSAAAWRASRPRRRPAGQARRRHAGPEGARQDADRTPRQRLLPLRAAAAVDRAERRRRFWRMAAATDRRPVAASGSGYRTGTAAATEAAVRDFARGKALKLGQVAQPLRAALTGRATSPGLFDVMTVLGREECLARLQRPATEGRGLNGHTGRRCG